MSNSVEEDRKVRKGTVTSVKMDKTITVDVEREFEHPLYEKRIRRNNHLKAHDEDEIADPGDIVQIVETRPLSKTKRWRLDEIIVKQEEQALEIEGAEEQLADEEEEVEEETEEIAEDADSSEDTDVDDESEDDEETDSPEE